MTGRIATPAPFASPSSRYAIRYSPLHPGRLPRCAGPTQPRPMINLQNARRYEDLLGADVEPAPYEFALLFQADGWLARRRAKDRFKLLRALDPKLREILRSGERVYFVTSGTTASLVEQFFVGAFVAQVVNRRALAFTTERVLLLQIDSRKRPRELVSQISYASIAEVKATWSGYCRLTLRNNEKLNFVGVPKADRQNLAAFLADVVKRGTTTPFSGSAQALEHLCPRCFAVVPGHPEQCPICRGGFKRARTAMLRSFLFPGLGDLYLGHRAVAVFEMLGAVLVWLHLIVAPLIGAPDADGNVVKMDVVNWVNAIVVLAIIHGIDAAATRHFALKGHHPA